jgi:rSAM/selenodomain-associated transferase 1
MVSEHGRLCIFARAPVLGSVKSRLARTLGEDAALAAHEEMVCQTLEELSCVLGIRSELWIAGAIDHPLVGQWAERWRMPVYPQHGNDLGARMFHAMTRCLELSPFGIVVGTDCPSVTAAYVREAALQLRDRELVLGPAEDGGYGLIGLSTCALQLFDGIPWGSARVLDETLKRAAASGLRYALLETVWDVDEPADWARYLATRPER